jgi:hypothetical protein
MRPAVHINGSLLSHPRQQHVIRDNLLRGSLHLLPDTHLRLTARLIVLPVGVNVPPDCAITIEVLLTNPKNVSGWIRSGQTRAALR